MKLYLIDTNVLIYALAGKNPWAKWVERWIGAKQLVLSSIVVAEFLTSATDSEAKIFEALLDRFGSLPVDTTVARLAADYRKRFQKKGRKLKLPDCLIAATAKLYRATLVTFNSKDYPMKDIKIFSP
ncbi:type II toxin-antitoxin system VapC family toxin [Candidatus Shapirobacteria bacterium]|nr:type II toxin-antitoxin system VapC family toxin [Candidatus Shapirobacteria bacterium]